MSDAASHYTQTLQFLSGPCRFLRPPQFGDVNVGANIAGEAAIVELIHQRERDPARTGFRANRHLQPPVVLVVPTEQGEMIMHRYIQLALVGAALTVPVAIRAQDRNDNAQTRRYEDKAHHDTHEWNEAEERAYRHYLEEHHRKYHEFDKANRREQEDYWKWRHTHPDEERH